MPGGQVFDYIPIGASSNVPIVLGIAQQQTTQSENSVKMSRYFFALFRAWPPNVAATPAVRRQSHLQRAKLPQH